MTPTAPTACLLAGLLALGDACAQGTPAASSAAPALDSPPAPKAQAPARPASRIPRDAFVLRPLEWIPGVPQARVLPVAFPETKPMGYIHALASTGERLWISAHPFADTNLPPTAGRLWSYHPASNQIGPATGILEGHAVSGLRARSDDLWLMIDGGLARLDGRTFAVDPFGAVQGLTSRNPVGVAETRRAFHALGDSGALYRLSADERSFPRFDASPPLLDANDTSAWRFLAGSGEWLLAATDRRLALRPDDAVRWNAQAPALRPRSPELDPVRILAVCGDGEGGFWIGSDAGLAFLQSSTGVLSFRERPGGVTVPGGVGIPIAAGMQPTAAAIEAARERVSEGIRQRMRTRARLARASAGAAEPVDAVTPASRIPGGVRALAMDRGFLWVATADPVFPLRSRILLFHPGSQKWVGWLPFAFPVTALAVDDRFLWIGADTQYTRATPLHAVEKSPLLSIPASRWTPDRIERDDLDAKVAALPPSEQVVFAFFSGDTDRVLHLTADGNPNDEQLFLRAMAHDPLGLGAPQAMAQHLRRLVLQHPDSLFAGLAAPLLERMAPEASAEAPTVRPAAADRGAPAGSPEASAPGPLAPSAPTAPAATLPTGPSPERTTPPQAATAAAPMRGTNPATNPPATNPAATLQRRDLNRDGRLNLVEWRLWLGPKAELGAWDRNGDGEIDRTEFQAFAEAHPER